LNKFHHGWCNSQSYVNVRLQKPQIVLVSDPFTIDFEDPAEVNSGLGFYQELPEKFEANFGQTA